LKSVDSANGAAAATGGQWHAVEVNAELMRRMRRLTATFNECHRADESLSIEQRHGSTMVLALRPWEAQLFLRLRRGAGTKRFV